MNYTQLTKASHLLLDHQLRHNSWQIFDEDKTAPENISIIARADGEFKNKLNHFLDQLHDIISDQFIYWLDQLHTTIAYFPLSKLNIPVELFVEFIKWTIRGYDIDYGFLGFLWSPNGEGVVWILEPKDGWRHDFAQQVESRFGMKQWKKMNNNIINTLIQKYAWMYVLKYKRFPSIDQIDYIKSLSDYPLRNWKPTEVCIYKTNSPLLHWAELLWKITII